MSCRHRKTDSSRKNIVYLGQHEAAHADTQDQRHATAIVWRLQASESTAALEFSARTAAAATSPRVGDIEKSNVLGRVEFTAPATAAAAPADATLDGTSYAFAHQEVADGGRSSCTKEANK